MRGGDLSAFLRSRILGLESCPALWVPDPAISLAEELWLRGSSVLRVQEFSETFVGLHLGSSKLM